MRRILFKLSVVATFVALIMTACSESDSPPRLIELATSLQADTSGALDTGKPFVIFVSQHGCEYCELLRQQLLYPLIKRGELEPRVFFREVSLDESFELTDFQGQIVKGKKFAQRYGPAITPTLLFLDHQGKSLTAPLVGTPNIEFYEFYFDRSIEDATKALSNS